MATPTSQPIALRPNSTTQDYTMQDANGSFSGSSSGPFNPGSYTPRSYGVGCLSNSCGSRIPVGSPTHRLLSSWEAGKTSSSLEGDRDSILNALNDFDREELDLLWVAHRGLHDVFKQSCWKRHIIVLDSEASNAQAGIQIDFNQHVNEST
ncbi:hypothetical protein DFP72DRAFT_893449 [Ephemerocybe angulata]|uniref:Uncharacterized protein n=1 Tax=Ephemerocybe angulata TaxID=980116 RepID=A0A8H6I2E6_9AGAR|nr:hypothetical protein DFP72DRAFT_893449 [Tulosesus angulatus]